MAYWPEYLKSTSPINTESASKFICSECNCEKKKYHGTSGVFASLTFRVWSKYWRSSLSVWGSDAWMVWELEKVME